MVHMGTLVTVSGAVGGIGTSTFAYAIALQCNSGAVLIDAQPDGVALDVLVGAEECAGTRWSQVRIRTAEINAQAILAALPQYGRLHILSSDSEAAADSSAIPFLVRALQRDGVDIILDISARDALRKSLAPEVDVLLMPPTLPGIVAARTALLAKTQVVLVEAGSFEVLPSRAAEYLDREFAGVVRWQRGVALSATAGAPPPAGTDVMQVAASILNGPDYVV